MEHFPGIYYGRYTLNDFEESNHRCKLFLLILIKGRSIFLYGFLNSNNVQIGFESPSSLNITTNKSVHLSIFSLFCMSQYCCIHDDPSVEKGTVYRYSLKKSSFDFFIFFHKTLIFFGFFSAFQFEQAISSDPSTNPNFNFVRI